MTRRMFSRKAVVSTSMAFLIAGGMAACDSGSSENPNEDGHYYCTDENGTVIDESFCDDPDDGESGGGGFFFMYMGSSLHAPPSGHSSYPVGSKMPTGAQKFNNTIANRRIHQLPPTGRISNGTIKTGVVGKGGAGSAPKGGSGGGKGSGGG